MLGFFLGCQCAVPSPREDGRHDPQRDHARGEHRDPPQVGKISELLRDDQGDEDGHALGEALHEHVNERFALVLFVLSKRDVKCFLG